MLMAFSTTLIANPYAKPSEPSGMLTLNQAHTAANIFPVTLYEVDGDQVIRRNTAVWLSPGTHTIRVSSKINLDNRSKFVNQRQKFNNSSKNNTLEITVEEGKTYYVGYDTNDRNPNKWRPVVWKVK